MPRLNHLWIVLPIGILIGFFISAESILIRLIAGISIAVPLLLIMMLVQFYWNRYLDSKYGFLRSENRFISLILKLVAAVAMADGEVNASEKKRILDQLGKAYPNGKAEQYMAEFEGYLLIKHPLATLCKEVDEEFDNRAKAQLLYVLISIVTADGILKEHEFDLIKKIVGAAKIRPQTLNTVLRLFAFQREQEQQSYQEPRKKTSASLLQNAYSVLGISEKASESEVKRAYRSLAKRHHPDKFIHLGEAQSKLANQKFQVILDAYELVKAARGIR